MYKEKDFLQMGGVVSELPISYSPGTIANPSSVVHMLIQLSPISI